MKDQMRRKENRNGQSALAPLKKPGLAGKSLVRDSKPPRLLENVLEPFALRGHCISDLM